MAIALNGATGPVPTVVNRTSGDADLLLSRYDVIHRYTGNGNVVDIGTLMEEDSVYEMHVNVISGNNANTNLDPYLRPNSATAATGYAGQFVSNNLLKEAGAQNTSTFLSTPIAKKHPASGIADNAQIQGFIFDGCDGIFGINGCFVMRLDTRRVNKSVLVYGGDTEGVFTGGAQWTDGVTAWSRVGSLRFFAGTGTPAATWASPDGAAVPAAVSYVINISRVY